MKYVFNTEDSLSVVKHAFNKINLINGSPEDFDIIDEDVDKIANQMDNVYLKGSADFSGKK